MHGTGLREGENHRSLRRSYSQHMRTVPPSVTTNRTIAAAGYHSAVVTSTISTSFNTNDSFFKDGRKISIGDCALFKPPQDSPPFIGIIRWLEVGKEKKLQIGVNWLYRPAEVKLGKGIQLDATPNEVFYSFHQDEIPAASLLHPCKVSFLPKGIELPAGIFSFICRRVYDIENNCLWWLSDQDYLNERQEEVDQLLDKTQREMHASMQSGGPSPKPTNVSTSTLQSKSSSENGQIGSTFSPRVKGKKRERGDQGADAIKRERFSKTDDGDSGIYRVDSLKSEIVKMTGKGGLVDLEGVEKFVQLMQPERMDKKMDLINRSLLAGVLAATDQLDCLNWFIQLRGLTVLDEWLQDIHKGKINDGSSSKDGDKSVEEFLLVLLRALDKLPVNLHALQMCNIGRSVNNLRSHKNLEIQKKARSLVDTWKKRVEAEIDGKSGSTQAAASWSSKSRLSEAAHGGSKTSNGSDVAMKSSITLVPGSKTSVKSSHVEIRTKSSPSSPGPVKSSSSSPASGKDVQPKISGCSASDVHPSREDKSGSSIQSHSFNPSVNDEGKGSGGSVNASKMSGSGSRHRRSVNGFPGTPVTGGAKETCSSRSSSLHRSAALKKSSPSAFNADKSLEAPFNEGSSHKLIVKLPKRGRAPAQSDDLGSPEDPSNMSSRASSPVHSEKDDQIDANPNGKSDVHLSNFTSDANMESWQSNEPKDALTGSDEAAGSPVAAALPREEKSMVTDVSKRISEASKRNEMKLTDASFRHMNALIESCVKYSEANSSVSLDDAIGMNLLASVAAGEISRSDLVSSTDSPERSPPAVDEARTHAEIKLSSPDNRIAGNESPCSDVVDGDRKNHSVAGTSLSEEVLHISKHTSLKHSGQRCASFDSNEPLLTLEGIEPVNLACMGKKSSADPQDGGVCEKSGEMEYSASLLPSGMVEKMGDGELRNLAFDEKAVSTSLSGNAILDCKPSANNNLAAKDTISHSLSNIEGGNQAAVVVSSYQSCDGDSKIDVKEVLRTGLQAGHELPANIATSVLTDRRDEEKLQSTGSERNLISENADKVKVEEEGNEKDPVNNIDQFERRNSDKGEDRSNAEDQDLNCLDSTIDETKSRNIEGSVQNKESAEHQSGASSPQKDSPAIYSKEAQKTTELKETTLPGVEADETEECASSLAEVSSSSAEPSEPDTKMKFDLNEGFIGDDGKYGEPLDLLAPDSTGVHVINPLPPAVSSVSSGLPASITVAAAAKGPFVPPEDLLISKSELGWKGSAATSAFRPAEPRKALEMPFGSTNVSCSDASNGRHVRPLLDIDLNVADERVHEDTTSRNLTINSVSDYSSDHIVSQNECIGAVPARGSGALDLDLNRVDESDEVGQCSSSSNFKMESFGVPIDSSVGLPSGYATRDFDLNDGPVVDDASAGQFTSHLGKGGMVSQLGPRMNNLELGNFPSWFPSGNTYSTVTIPSMLPDRGDQQLPIIPPGAPQRMFAPGGTPFPLDVYRGPVLSSSPAIAFPSSSFQYPVFPFGATFPLPSATVGTMSYVDSSSGGRILTTPVNSQFLGHVGAVSSQLSRPYLVSLPESSSNGGLDNNRKWGRPGLDLNAGPGSVDIEGREEMLPLLSRQLSVSGSQALAEEQARMLSVSGGILKRKEPEGGWDNESFRYKQSSWQ